MAELDIIKILKRGIEEEIAANGPDDHICIATSLARKFLAALEDGKRLREENRKLLCDLSKAAWAQCGCLGGTISHYDDRTACDGVEGGD